MRIRNVGSTCVAGAGDDGAAFDMLNVSLCCYVGDGAYYKYNRHKDVMRPHTTR